jgi:hypothetical protein
VPGNRNISRLPWQRGSGYVANRPLKVAVFHTFDDHNRNTDARDIELADDTIAARRARTGHGIQGHRFVRGFLAKFRVSLAS